MLVLNKIDLIALLYSLLYSLLFARVSRRFEAFSTS